MKHDDESTTRNEGGERLQSVGETIFPWLSDIQARLAAPMRECPKCHEMTLSGMGTCDPCTQKREAEAEEERHRDALAPALESVKDRFRWAEFGHPDFAKYEISAPAVAKCRAIPLRGIITLTGGSGVGKTTAAVARFHAELRVPRDQRRWGYTSRFIACREIGRETMTHKIGSDFGPKTREAFAAHLLVLDDLGAEGESKPVAERIEDIISERADSNSCVTIITTGLPLDKIAARYTDAIGRRVSQNAVIDMAARGRTKG